MNAWEVLEIDATRDVRAIKSAYAKKLKITRPDDDPDAYHVLVRAYEQALEYAAGEAPDDPMPAAADTSILDADAADDEAPDAAVIYINRLQGWLSTPMPWDDSDTYVALRDDPVLDELEHREPLRLWILEALIERRNARDEAIEDWRFARVVQAFNEKLGWQAHELELAHYINENDLDWLAMTLQPGSGAHTETSDSTSARLSNYLFKAIAIFFIVMFVIRCPAYLESLSGNISGQLSELDQQMLEVVYERTQRGAHDEALSIVSEQLERFGDDGPRMAPWLRARGVLYWQMKRYEAARQDLKRAVAVTNENDIDLLNLLAWFYAVADDPKVRDGQRAVALALKANRLAPESVPLIDTLAAAYARNGEFPQAIEEQKRALGLLKVEDPNRRGFELRLEMYERGEAYTDG